MAVCLDDEPMSRRELRNVVHASKFLPPSCHAIGPEIVASLEQRMQMHGHAQNNHVLTKASGCRGAQVLVNLQVTQSLRLAKDVGYARIAVPTQS